MTYLDVINTIEKEVVTDGLWASDADKYADLRNLLYVAALSVADGLPLSHFDLSSSIGAVDEVSSPEEVPLPNDLFRFRDDLGFDSLVINGRRYQPMQQNKFGSVLHANANVSFYADDEVLFHVDLQSRIVYGLNLGAEVEFKYLPLFPEPEPTEVVLGSADYPIEGKEVRSAISLVSAHLQGNRKRDSQGAQFNMMLTNLYGGAGNG